MTNHRDPPPGVRSFTVTARGAGAGDPLRREFPVRAGAPPRATYAEALRLAASLEGAGCPVTVTCTLPGVEQLLLASGGGPFLARKGGNRPEG